MSIKQPSSSIPIINKLSGISIKGTPINGQSLQYDAVNNILEWVTNVSSTSGITTVIKKFDESITEDTVLHDDNELFIPLEANMDYNLFFALLFNSEVAASFKSTWSLPLGSGGNRTNNPLQPSSSTDVNIIDLLTVPGSDTNNIWTVYVARILAGSTPGNLQFMWAQSTSHIPQTIVRAGSYIQLAKQQS